MYRAYRKLHLILGQNAVNIKNTKTVGKHGEVVEKPLYKCIGEGLIYLKST